jgi:hypothetical protein
MSKVSFRSFLLVAAVLLLAGCAQRNLVPPQPAVPPALHDELTRQALLPYEELFETAPSLSFRPAELRLMREHLGRSQDYCAQKAKANAQHYEQQAAGLLEELKRSGNQMDDTKRHELHCRIRDLRSSKAQMDLLEQQLIPTAYGNSRAKLELIEKWPAQLQEINAQIASGASKQRRWGNVADIGVRQIEGNQQDDIKRGQDAMRELQRQGVMPPELANQQVQDYVNTVAQRIARNSDLQVPLKVTVLDSREVNAFALPGGFLFVQRGLLEEADDEAELAGVLAHEMAHVTARHSHRLYKKAMISSLVFQSAQIAALILTGGASSLATAYALQYGFYGLGFALDLNLLGVSREYELEADQLGIQYAWKSGYDPNGFIRFFDKLAGKHGYAIGASWFRTHPPFYERMVHSKREMLYLPPKEAWIVQTTEFEEMKPVLREIAKKSNAAQDAKRPSLLSKEERCEAPPPQLYKPEDAIETICSAL